MARFLQKEDYAMQVKSEIIKLLLTSNDDEWFLSAALIRAENTAISQIKNRIGKRYDCTRVFAPAESSTVDNRDQWIVTIAIDISLYHLYSKSGSKDVPQHRQDRYQDAIDWLKDVGNGETLADLPTVVDENTGEAYSEFRLSSRTPENHKW
jgi:phage gp36-like protein